MAIGWGEYQVIHPSILTLELGVWGLIEISLMVLFVGVVEEFIFRSVLQTAAGDMFGKAGGLLIASILFGFMHSEYHMPREILFTAIVGIITGVMFLKTSSLPMVVLAHGAANISLFFIVPAYFELFLPIIAISLLISAVAFMTVERLSRILDPIQ